MAATDILGAQIEAFGKNVVLLLGFMPLGIDPRSHSAQ
jgi:hypothetical protein